MRKNKNRKKLSGSAERNNTIVIRQPETYRILTTVLASLLLTVTVCLSVWIWISAREGAGIMAMVLVLMMGFICVPMVLWYATWKVVFHEGGIRKRLFGCTTRDYTWEQVQRVENFYPYGQFDYIYVVFADGKRLNFRMDCDNAHKAKRFLLSRFSVILTGRHRLNRSTKH